MIQLKVGPRLRTVLNRSPNKGQFDRGESDYGLTLWYNDRKRGGSDENY